MNKGVVRYSHGRKYDLLARCDWNSGNVMSFIYSNSTIAFALGARDMAITVFSGALVIVVGAWILYLFSKRNYKNAKRQQRLVDKFFNPWLINITGTDNKYCKIGAKYSNGRFVPLEPNEPKEPSNHRFYYEVMNHPRKYKPLIKDWKSLKDITSKINEEYAALYNEIRVNINTKINLPYWCPEPESDEPLEGYMCYNTFIKAIYDEIEYKLSKPKKRQFYGNGEVLPITRGIKNDWYFKWGNDLPLAVSPKKELMDTTKVLFEYYIQDEKYKEKIKALSNKQKETYDIALEKVIVDIENIIESIELDNEVEKKIQHIVKPF